MKRAVAKAITYRVAGLLLTFSVVFIFTGELTVSVGVCIVESIVKIIAYFLHEMMWQKWYPS